MNIGDLFINLTESPRPVGEVTLEAQVEAFNALSSELYDSLVEGLQDPETKQHILGLALERLKLGYVEYRDDMFHEHDAFLGRMALEELADAINWSLPIRAAGCWECEKRETCDSWE